MKANNASPTAPTSKTPLLLILSNTAIFLKFICVFYYYFVFLFEGTNIQKKSLHLLSF